MGKGKLAVLGASRGLGAAVSLKLFNKSYELWLASRKEPQKPMGLWQRSDFSQESNWPQLVDQLRAFGPEVIIYCAGGGPYAPFGEKEWKSQEWAHRVTFSCPAFLLWNYCRGEFLRTKRFLVIGSAVAEDQPDPNAAMYCASKHALRGLIRTLQLESPDRQIHLFSAPYMDTDLLPKGAWPRQQPNMVRSAEEVAEEVLRLALGPI